MFLLDFSSNSMSKIYSDLIFFLLLAPSILFLTLQKIPKQNFSFPMNNFLTPRLLKNHFHYTQKICWDILFSRLTVVHKLRSQDCSLHGTDKDREGKRDGKREKYSDQFVPLILTFAGFSVKKGGITLLKNVSKKHMFILL